MLGETFARVWYLHLPRRAGEMSRSDTGGLALLDQISRRRRCRDLRPPSAFGISPRKAGGECCKGLLGRMTLAVVSVVFAGIVVACGGGAVPDAGPAAEVRVTVNRVSDDALAVGLEVRGAESDSYERVLPQKHELTLADAEQDWWESSEIAVAALGVVRIGAGSEGFGLDGASRQSVEPECGVLVLVAGAESKLVVTAPTAAAVCLDTGQQFEIAPGDSKPILLRAALRIESACADLRLDLRPQASGRGDWRSFPAGSICGLDQSAANEWQVGATLAIPYHSEVGVLEARVVNGSVSAAVDGVLLPNPCAQIWLIHGFRSVWQREQEAGRCDGTGTHLRWLLWVAHPPTPDDPEDRQQYQSYDWELEVVANYLPPHWLESITIRQAERIVRALYQDFYGDTAEPPAIAVAPSDADHLGAYDWESHTIELAPASITATLVLHEAAHAMLRLSAELDAVSRYYLASRHGPRFTQHLLAIWDRYSEDLDVEAIRAAADWHEVGIADGFSFPPRGGKAEREAVIEALSDD